MTAATETYNFPGASDVILTMSENEGRMCSHMGGFVTCTLSKALNCLNQKEKKETTMMTRTK